MIVDLGSTNGTFVNGERVQRHTLRPGDEIRIGGTRITFHGQTGR
jgi:pSer/pThr/pTyr-binding forkhead associated (FHA) protein